MRAYLRARVEAAQVDRTLGLVVGEQQALELKLRREFQNSRNIVKLVLAHIGDGQVEHDLGAGDRLCRRDRETDGEQGRKVCNIRPK